MPTGTVTFLFTDVEGSTRRWDAHPVVMQSAMARHDSILRQGIESQNGVIFTTAGDAFCAVFASPTDALTAAVSIQGSLGHEEWGEVAPFLVRMALHTGNADERDGDYFGPPLNRCARLLAIGNGGQVLVSSATSQLLADHLPGGAELVDLGPHQLKDMDRSEHVFIVRHADLTGIERPLRSESAKPGFEILVERGRIAHAAEEWEAAYTALTEARGMGTLDVWDLQKLADTAFWTGRGDEAISLKEATYASLVEASESEDAAMMALELAFLYKYRLASAVTSAWVARAEKLLEGSIGTRGEGYLLRFKTAALFDSGDDPEAAIEFADRVIDIGRTLPDKSLESLGLMDKGRILVAMGRIDEGMTLVDESMIAAVAREIDADAIGRNYCNMLSVCDQIADYERASEWSDAAEAWCTQHSDSAYPGICRITRAELKWLHGDWQEATVDLHRAIDELTGFTPIIGAALYQMGEVELRAGNLDAAAEHFTKANEHAFMPLPGLAALKLAEGDAIGGEQLLLNALVASPQPLQRARFLPTLIDIELELGNLAEATTFIEELEATAELTDSTAMRAQALDRRAALSRSNGSFELAAAQAQDAIQCWSALRMPYEAAQSRLCLAAVYEASGNGAAASLEMGTATATLDRLTAHSR